MSAALRLMALLPVEGTSFDHPAGLDADATHYFAVTAVNAAGESVESCEVNARITGNKGGNC